MTIQTIPFFYTGACQPFVVPEGVSRVRIKAWGAGGGQAAENPLQNGGPGGYAEGSLTVSPGDILTIVVGEAGKPCSDQSTYGGGGAGGAAPLGYFAGASGGGRSAVIYRGEEVLTAGGGGGAGGGKAGENASADNLPLHAAGCGGMQTVGGAGGVNSANSHSNGFAGSFLQGGTGGCGGEAGPNARGNGGGGGGGGYYGGGGGAGQLDAMTQPTAAGGGGCGYLGSVTAGFLLCTAPTSAAPDDQTLLPPHTSDPDYRAGVGIGGGVSPAGDGLVVVQFLEPDPPPSRAVAALTKSVEMQETALLHLLQAESEKLQNTEGLGLDDAQLRAINDSIAGMISSFRYLNAVLQQNHALLEGRVYATGDAHLAQLAAQQGETKEAKPDEPEAHEVEVDEVEVDEVEVDEVEVDEVEVDEVEVDEVEVDEVEVDEVEVDEVEVDEVEVDEVEVDEAQADESEADEVQADEPEENKLQQDETQPPF